MLKSSSFRMNNIGKYIYNIRNYHVFKVNEQNSNVISNSTNDIFIKNTQTKYDINSIELINHIDKIRNIMGVSMIDNVYIYIYVFDINSHFSFLLYHVSSFCCIVS